MENEFAPSLTLTPDLPEELAAPVLETQPEAAKETAEEAALTDAEKKMVKDFAAKINLTDSTQIIQYGAGAQTKISQFSEAALANVRTKDLDEVGALVTGLVGELRGFNSDEPKGGLRGLFRRAGNSLQQMKTKYASAEKNVDRITGILEGHKVTLLKDIAMLDKMYEMNLAYYKELTMYILAGREKLEQVISTDLPAAQEKARQSGLQSDAQAANDLADKCNRFDKKLHDLELTRNICLQMGPQIRLVQSNNTIMLEKIHSSIVNTIPLWKNQMVLALGVANSAKAIQAQRAVTDMTNELLKKNADTIKQGTIEAAKESERGIVDIETLQHTNQSLIETLDEVLMIQQDGKQKREAAQAELSRIEDQLKNKLLEVRNTPR
ncbi:MAG: toxic anion resistance protein [Oscillospiraceae bacterium]|nr:toxic anion resistance protein [Oscillospiraceae bacterium]